jgi:putative methyltransferase (TIGR04325 family)
MKGHIWEGVYANFAEVPVTGPGFAGETWTTRGCEKLADLRRNAALGAGQPGHAEGLLPVTVALALARKGAARVLDFGGGLGFAWYPLMAALPDQARVRLQIVEGGAVCRAGREAFAGVPEVSFHEALGPELAGPDIAHFGSSLHYIEDWRGLLAAVCALGPETVLLADLPAGDIPTYASAQNYYGSKIPMWFFNLDEIVDAVRGLGYVLRLRCACLAPRLGKVQAVPQDNFAPGHRLGHTKNLLFSRES